MVGFLPGVERVCGVGGAGVDTLLGPEETTRVCPLGGGGGCWLGGHPAAVTQTAPRVGSALVDLVGGCVVCGWCGGGGCWLRCA